MKESNGRPARLLVVGAGSIGERHVRAFTRLGGVAIAVVEPRRERLREVRERYACSAAFASFDEVPLEEYDAAVIATPANSHMELGLRCAARGLHVMVEKPITVEAADARALIDGCRQGDVILAVGYTLRAHPVFRKAKELVAAGVLGDLWSVQAMAASRIAEARPDFRQTYFASARAGGGVILDLSHELNYVQALTGPLSLQHCARKSLANLGVETETVADLQLVTRAGGLVHIHLHYADGHARRQCWCCGSKGSLHLDFFRNTVAWNPTSGEPLCWNFADARDDWHLRQAREFLDATKGRCQPACTGEEALDTLFICREALSGTGAAATS